jgi:hypothetical protein
MHRAVTFHIGGQKFHLLKLIGAFIVIAAAIMLLSDVFKLMQVADIIGLANQGVPQSVSLELSGVTVTKLLEAGDAELQTGMLLVPIAGILFWAAIVIAGRVFYRAGGILIPIEEDIKDTPPKKKKKVKRG